MKRQSKNNGFTLIEATIAEVTLSNSLDYGIRWFLENSKGEIGFNAPVPTSAEGSGLAFAFFNDSRPDVYNEEAASDAWRMTLAFFREHLG